MTEFYLFLSSRDSVYHKNGFWIEFPKPYLLEGNWTCALTEITLTCDFKPRSPRIYLCSDIVQESYVHNALIEIVRNVEIGTRYKKVKSESYLCATDRRRTYDGSRKNDKNGTNHLPLSQIGHQDYVYSFRAIQLVV